MCDLCLRQTAYAKGGWTCYLAAESLACCWSDPSGLSWASLMLNWIQYLKREEIWREAKKSKMDIFLDSSVSIQLSLSSSTAQIQQRCHEARRDHEQAFTAERAAPAFMDSPWPRSPPCCCPVEAGALSTPLSIGAASKSWACSLSEVGTVSIRELKIERGLVCFPQ